jgi:hypothetical protein
MSQFTTPEKSRAVVIQHPRAVVHLVDPETGASIDAAKTYQRKERAWGLASVLAGFDDLNLGMVSARERDHYVGIAMLAMDLAKKGPAL